MIDNMLNENEMRKGKKQKDEVAALYLSSIHTKLAILEVTSPEKT